MNQVYWNKMSGFGAGCISCQTAFGRAFATMLVAIALTSCGGRAYVYETFDPVVLQDYSETQTKGDIRVTASAPGADEAKAIFGVPLFDNDIQPVWLQVENNSSSTLRFAPVGTDRFYFSPMEVAWKYRGGYSSEGQALMEKRFHSMVMDRYILPGETESGFVFTNKRPGAKAINVDLFGPGTMYDFTFLLAVPGFVADYANIDFESIDKSSGVAEVSRSEFPNAIEAFGCCTSRTEDNEPGNPINIILVGEGITLLHSLLRANWVETTADEAKSTRAAYLFGRKQDAIFRNGGKIKEGYYELRLWMAPMKLEDDRVWLGQVRHIIDHPWIDPRPDPDVDNARSFFLQNLWYSQSLAGFGWLSGESIAPIESNWFDLDSDQYFTDGDRLVAWLSSRPVSMVGTEIVEWSETTGDQKK